MKTNALRVSYLRVYLCVVLLFAVGNVARATYSYTINNAGTMGTTASNAGCTVTRTSATSFSVTYSGPGEGGWNVSFGSTNATTVGGVGTSAFSGEGGAGTATFSCDVGKYFYIVYRVLGTGGDPNDTFDYYLNPSPVDNQLSWGIAANAGPNPVHYQVWRNADNVPVASSYREVGAGPTTITITVPSDKDYGDYTLHVWIPNLLLAGGGAWAVVNPGTSTGSGGLTKPADGAETVFTPTVTPTSAHVVPAGTTVTPANTVPAPTPPVQPNVAVKPPGTGGAIWNAGGGSGGLTDEVFKEGIDKLVVGQTVANGHLGTLAGLADDIQGAKGDGETATAGSEAQGTAAKTAAQALFPSVPSAPIAPGAGAMPNFGFSFGGAVVNINPFTSDRFETIASWFRASLAWLTLVLLGWWLWTQMGEWIRGFSTIQQARGNAVVGGTGAQATALIAAGAITVIIVTGITGLVGWASGDVGFSIVTSALATTTPAASMAADLPGAFWILNKLFPLSTMFAALIARVTFNMYASGLFAGVMAAIRFVVP